jgi:Uncharacterized protein conserved in bacteria (DUF2188)
MRCMGEAFHITKRSSGWAVMRSNADRASSLHRTQAEAVAAGRRLALKSGGADIVIHAADGRIRDRDTVGAAALELNRQGRADVGQRPAPRAPRSEGSRTTLRLPDALAAVAERLASELNISRNDALLRLATRGARLYEAEHSIAVRRAERWAAVVPGVVDLDHADFPSPGEAQAAILAARDQARSAAT